MAEEMNRRDFLRSSAVTAITLAGIGTLSLGPVDEAEAGELKKVLTPEAVAEGTAIFDRLVNHQKTIHSLNNISKEPSDKIKKATLPAEVVAEFLKSAPNLQKCNVNNIEVGFLIPAAGQAKIILRFVTNQKGPDGEFIAHQFSRPATKR